MGEEIRLRAASPADAEQVLGIYAPYVRKTAITFEYDVPSLEEFRGRMEAALGSGCCPVLSIRPVGGAVVRPLEG